MRGRVSAFLGALLLACAECHAVLDYTGGWFYDFTLTGPGWHAYKNLRDIGGPENEYRRISPSQLSVGDGIGTTESLANSVCFALALKNTSTNRYQGFAIGFYAEQWRITSVAPSEFRILFDWGVFDTFTTELPNGVGNPSTIIPHTPDKPSDFTRGYSGAGGEMHITPFIQHTTHGPLNGNLAANRRRRFAVVDRLNWMPGQYLILRWFAGYGPSVQAHALAVDDLWFRAAKQGEIDFLGANVTGAPPQFVACGFPAVEHEVQESVDLRQWLPVTTMSSESGRLAIPTSSAGPQRFYRLVKP